MPDTALGYQLILLQMFIYFVMVSPNSIGPVPRHFASCSEV